jgi:hypothetical protein
MARWGAACESASNFDPRSSQGRRLQGLELHHFAFVCWGQLDVDQASNTDAD